MFKNSLKIFPTPMKRFIKDVLWVLGVKLSPPPRFVKKKVVANAQKISGYKIFVETGTYLGDMVNAQKDNFKKIISIELDTGLFERAKERFKGVEHIRILKGDSGQLLPGVCAALSEPAVFWLDGHYSPGKERADKDTPISKEVEAIFENDLGHILLIDDARCFDGKNDYPVLEDFLDHLETRGRQAEVKDDIIRIFPK